MDIIKTLKRLALAAWLGACMSYGLAANAQTLDEILNTEEKANKYAQQTQEEIDEIASETRDIVAEYRQVLRQIESLQIYNAQIQKLIKGQEKEIARLQSEISDVTEINRRITPLMLEMVDALAQFVKLDIPFLQEERQERIAELRDLMNRSDVSTAEKFRRVLEAYQIEIDYGRTVEAYAGQLNRDGQSRTVDYLQIGRVVFAYLTRDGNEAGIWDHEERQWETLPDSYISTVSEGIRMAREQVTPDLIALPVPAPEEVQ